MPSGFRSGVKRGCPGNPGECCRIVPKQPYSRRFPRRNLRQQDQLGVYVMTILSQISFDEIAGSLMVCLLLREVLIQALPDRIAGPGGWLIDTGADEA
jgi:hypothetical protein